MPPLTLTVNGRDWAGEVQDGTSLLDVLRDRLNLTGAKLGCGEGQCGSCTVLMDGRAVAACTISATAASARTITTVEGLATGDRLHPVQQAFVEHQAFQCGFCTPGMIIASVALVDRNPQASEDEIRQALDRHLCRCGTYGRIIDAVRAAGTRMARERR